MNPGLHRYLVDDRQRALRGTARRAADVDPVDSGVAADGTAAPWRRAGSWRRRPAGARRRVLRPVGLALVRVGRRLAGPETDGASRSLPHPGWSRS